MAQFNIAIDVPVNKRDEVLDGVVYVNGYTDTISGPPDASGNETSIPNPETKVQALQRILRDFMRNHYVAYQRKQAREAAEKAADQAADQVKFT